MTRHPFMHALVTKYGEWLYRSILLGAVCISLWLNSKYVTRDEFAALKKDVESTSLTLRIMAEQNQVNERQNEELKDHEARLRALEAVIPRGIR